MMIINHLQRVPRLSDFAKHYFAKTTLITRKFIIII